MGEDCRYAMSNELFDVFVEEFERCVERFGLIDWQVYYEKRDIGEESRAQIEVNPVGRVATVTLNSSWECEPREVDVVASARHEAVHLALEPFNSYSAWRYVSQDERIASLEEAVRRISNIVFGREVATYIDNVPYRKGRRNDEGKVVTSDMEGAEKECDTEQREDCCDRNNCGEGDEEREYGSWV